MRQSKKLGFLGLVAALVAALGLLASGGAHVSAQVTIQDCSGPAANTTTTVCTFPTTTNVPAGNTITLTTTAPGVTISGVSPAGIVGVCGPLTGLNSQSVILGPCGNIVPGTTITMTFTVPTSFNTPANLIIPLAVTYNSNALPVGGGGGVGGLCSPPTGATGTLTCVNAFGTAIPAGTTIDLTVTPGAGETLTLASATFPPQPSGNACSIISPAIGTPFSQPTTVEVLCTGPVSANASTTLSFTSTGGTTAPTEVTTTGGAIGPTTENIIFTAGFIPTPVPPVNANQPTTETKVCNIPGTGVQVGTSFTIPLFTSAPITCAIVLSNAAGSPVADGNVIVALTSPGSSAVISCFTGAVPSNFFSGLTGLPTGFNAAQALGNTGTCQSQSSGVQLSIPCGATAPNGTTVSKTCTAVLFNIQSVLGSCVSTPVTGCPLGSNFNLNSNVNATVQISFLATPGNGGQNGGIVLGNNTFNFTSPGIGTLLVTASPQLIPSNGTIASVVTATFACGSGVQFVNGFPLSAFGFSNATNSTIVANQPILGVPSPNSPAVCGAGLPGTFNFATPGPVLFDNGRSSEAVSCGLNSQDNLFGVGGNAFNPLLTNPTLPLVFTCTGAAVLAIGAGAAGDAPINVTYTSQFGGLTAVGSTLITVSPSGVPRISIACNPSTIAAGNTGSICTATVTDQNGIPLTGVTGATVTFTVSDPSEATILPCVVGQFGALNVTTSPNIVPQIVPNTPCLTPSGTIPGQANTFINGQATALLVASSYARPETVTVTASLGILIPPEFACLVSPYTPTGFGTLTSGNTITSSVGLPGLTGCGFGNPVGFTGLASALSIGSAGLTGIVTLPNTTSASTTVNIGGPAGILIAGATTTTPLQLTRGCNQVIVTSTQGTPIANIAALVSPASAVVSIWRFSNSTKQFQAGFFSDPAAPTDFIATGGVGSTGTINQPSAGAVNNQITETYFICVNQAATIISS